MMMILQSPLEKSVMVPQSQNCTVYGTALCESIRYQAKSEQNVRQDLIPRVRHGEAALCTPLERKIWEARGIYRWRINQWRKEWQEKNRSKHQQKPRPLPLQLKYYQGSAPLACFLHRDHLTAAIHPVYRQATNHPNTSEKIWNPIEP